MRKKGKTDRRNLDKEMWKKYQYTSVKFNAFLFFFGLNSTLSDIKIIRLLVVLIA